MRSPLTVKDFTVGQTVYAYADDNSRRISFEDVVAKVGRKFVHLSGGLYFDPEIPVLREGRGDNSFNSGHEVFLSREDASRVVAARLRLRQLTRALEFHRARDRAVTVADIETAAALLGVTLPEVSP